MTEHRHPISIFGFAGGLVAGLAISVAIALYLTHSPVPFINKVQRSTENITPEPGDPNKSLFSPQIPTAQPGEAGRALPPPADARDGGAGAVGSTPVPGTPAAAPAPVPDTAVQGDGGPRLMLQVGAFRNADDADAIRARLALLGLDAKVTTVQVDGNTLYRVRLGPYGQLDDLNGIQRTLSENGMEPQIVHVH